MRSPRQAPARSCPFEDVLGGTGESSRRLPAPTCPPRRPREDRRVRGRRAVSAFPTTSATGDDPGDQPVTAPARAGGHRGEHAFGLRTALVPQQRAGDGHLPDQVHLEPAPPLLDRHDARSVPPDPSRPRTRRGRNRGTSRRPGSRPPRSSTTDRLSQPRARLPATPDACGRSPRSPRDLAGVGPSSRPPGAALASSRPSAPGGRAAARPLSRSSPRRVLHGAPR